ncbi:hypothetical protein [Halopiger thermotolerans]
MAPDSVPTSVRNRDANADREVPPADDGRDRAASDRRDARPLPAARSESPARTHACPLCGYTDESRDSVFTHLLLGHRKRAISSALLEVHSSAGGAGRD